MSSVALQCLKNLRENFAAIWWQRTQASQMLKQGWVPTFPIDGELGARTCDGYAVAIQHQLRVLVEVERLDPMWRAP